MAATSPFDGSPRRSVDVVAPSLASAFDDDRCPTSLTIFSEADDEITTNWITIDLAHALVLDEMA